MAIDNTPPRLKLIVTIAVITVITLIAIDFATKSYFAMMTDEAKHEKIAPTRDKDEQMKAEQAALTGASMPVDKAMAEVAKAVTIPPPGGQSPRPEAITPQASDDVGPVTGWSKLPHPAPTLQHPVGGAMPTDVPTIGDGGVMLGPDGGIMLGPDGGPMMAPTADAGAPAPAPADAGVRPRGPRPQHGEPHP